MTKKKSATDYKFIKILGEGSFSSVYLAVDAEITSARIRSFDMSQNESGIELESDSSDNQHGPINDLKSSTSSTKRNNSNSSNNNHNKIRKYAIKVCLKRHIKKYAKQEAIMREKNILNILNENLNDHFIRLYCTFQDVERLYFVMTYAENGDLLSYMQEHPLSLNIARNYTLQLVDALEHIHKLGIVHRDLKPENILLDENMNLLLSDFGSAQIYPENDDNGDAISNSNGNPNRRNSFVGTAQYVSPEMLTSRQASNKSDLWALGVIIYQLITNIMPFNAPNEYLIYQKIQILDYQFTEDFDPKARDLITSLIKLEPMDRLGSKDDIRKTGYVSIRKHCFLDCDAVDEQQYVDAEDCLDRDNITKPACLNDKLIEDRDLADIDHIKPGLDELQFLRMTIG